MHQTCTGTMLLRSSQPGLQCRAAASSAWPAQVSDRHLSRHRRRSLRHDEVPQPCGCLRAASLSWSHTGPRVWGLRPSHYLSQSHLKQLQRGLIRTGAVSSSPATGAVVKLGSGDVRWGSALSRNVDLEEAMDEAIASILDSIGPNAQPELAMVFASSVHGKEFSSVVPLLRKKLPSLKTVFGCSGYGAAGGSASGPIEVEGEPAFSLTLGQLPGVNVRVLHTLRSSIPGEDTSPETWAQFVGVAHNSIKPTSFIILADPRFAQVRDLVAGLDYAFPNAPKIGSILSTGSQSKSRAMWAWSADGLSGHGPSSLTATPMTRAGLRGRLAARGEAARKVAAAMNDEDKMAAAVLAVMKSTGDKSVAGSGSDSDGSSSSSSSAASSSQGSEQDSGNQVAGAGEESGDKGGKGSKGGLLGSFFNAMLGAKDKAATPGEGGSDDKADGKGPALQRLDQASKGASSLIEAVKASMGSRSGSEGADSDHDGLYLYGAVVLALQGDVQLDVITSMGYRAPSPNIWRIASISDANNIVSVWPEEMAAQATSGGKAVSPGSKGALVSREAVSDSDSDDSDDDDGDDGSPPELQAITMLVDMLDNYSNGDPERLQDWNDLLETAVIAVAADNSKPASELGPEDWELLPLQDIMDEYGVLVVGDSPVVGGGVDLRRGNRIKLMVRDAEGVREDLRTSLLSYKRRDLAAMLQGRSLPPTFGGLLFTDVDRGSDCYEEDSYESKTAHTYIPTPISGVFGAAQIAPLQGSGNGTAILEYAAVLGVLRAAQERSSDAIKAEASALGAAVKRTQGEGSGQPSSDSDESTSSADKA